jgi:hypothetical protein
MFVEGTLRWKVTEDCPWDMLMALCLRDMAGLRDLGDPVLPALEPAVPAVARSRAFGSRLGRARPASGRQEALRAQWLDWWSTSAALQTRPYFTAVRPPHFTAFDRQLELRELIETHYVAAARWVDEQHEAYVHHCLAHRETFAADIIMPVREREHVLRRQAGYFRLDLCVLPLSEAGAWIVAPDTIAISRSLREDVSRFRAWWRTFVDVLV